MINIPDRLRKPLTAILIGSALTASVSQYEGFEPEAYHATKAEKFHTIGYGSTRHPDGTPIQEGEVITRKQAEDYLKNDLEGYKKFMLQCIKVPLLDQEFNAYASLTYNIGPTSFCKSTLVKRLNSFDYEGACKEILKWNRQGGVVLKGLDNRRKEEYKTCISG